MQSFNCRDRTSEYLSTIEGFRRQQSLTLSSQLFSHSNSHLPSPLPYSSSSSSSSYSSSSSSNGNGKISRQSQFTEAASKISKNITFVTEQLEKLTLLAKQRSLFEDQSLEINKLTSIIRSDITDIKTDLEYLESFSANNKGTGRQNEQNSIAIVKDLKNKFVNTSRSFVDVLQIRSQSLKDQNSRRKHFENSNSNSIRTRKVNPLESLLKNEYVGTKKNNMDDNDNENENERNDNHNNESDPLLQQEQQLAPQEDQYLASRHAAVQQIEEIIAEISQMFLKLTTILAKQEEDLKQISDDTQDTYIHTQSAYEQLTKYFESVSSEKILILKVFAVLILFLIFFVIFVA